MIAAPSPGAARAGDDDPGEASAGSRDASSPDRNHASGPAERARAATRAIELRLGGGVLTFPEYTEYHGSQTFVLGKASLELATRLKRQATGFSIGLYIHYAGFSEGGTLAFGPTLHYDFQVLRGRSWYLGPTLALGGALPLPAYFNDSVALDVQLGLTTRVVLNDTWELWLRPLNAELWIPEQFFPGFDVTLGIGRTF